MENKDTCEGRRGRRGVTDTDTQEKSEGAWLGRREESLSEGISEMFKKQRSTQNSYHQGELEGKRKGNTEPQKLSLLVFAGQVGQNWINANT